MASFLPIFLLLALALLFVAGNLILSHLLGPRRSYPGKFVPYECGIPPTGNARVRVPIHFYLVAILFVLFDIEIVFLYPWAVLFKELGVFGFIEMFIFLGLLFIGLIYIWRRGALEWQ